tara:strand:- start:2494 stop:4170 length:1677 start_codon:yes stop_codon:yes gene_type:complete
MSNIIRLLKQIVGNHKSKFIFLNFITLLATLADMLSLGTLTVYISFIFDKQILIELLEKYGFENLFFFLYKDNSLILLTIALILAFFVKNIFLFYVNYFEINFIKDLRVEKTKLLFHKYINLNYKTFVSKNFSHFQRSIFNEVQLIIVTLQQIIIFMKESTLILGILILFLIINFKLTIFVFTFLLFISATFFYFTKKKLKNYGKIGLNHRRLKHKIFNEFGSFFKDIKIFNLQAYFLNSFISNVSGDEVHRAYGDIISRLPRLIFEILCVSLIFIILLFFEMNNINSKYYITTITFFGLGMIRMLPSFNLISGVLSKIKTNEISSLSILKELEEETINGKKNINYNYNYSFSEKINLKDITFSYQNNTVIKKFDLDIKKNTTTCIYGSSGSGKTTILNIIGGLIKPDKGKVLCDDQDIYSNVNSWQKNMISYMGQDTFVLNNTIEKNITLDFANKDLNNSNLEKIIQELGLEKLYDQLITFESSQSLSGGEKQRIGFARAIYKNSPILLFDEPTNNLDEENENTILNKINLLNGKKTIVIVTHNPKFKSICDKIITL